MPLTTNSSEMNEHIIAFLALDEAVAFGVIEPLYNAAFSLFHGKNNSYEDWVGAAAGRRICLIPALKKPFLLIVLINPIDSANTNRQQNLTDNA